MTSNQSLQRLLKSAGIRPQKALGQNFLQDGSFLLRIVEAAQINQEDEVLEIGAGVGSLTRHLAQTASQVCAVEIDQRLMPLLQAQLSMFPNVHLVAGDILQLELSDLVSSQGYKVVANIPYYLTSHLIRHLLESDPSPSCLVLTIQREVAERICAQPGEMSLLALCVQVYGKPKIALHIPAEAFYPIPKVDSATLVVELYVQPLIGNEHLDDFFNLAKYAFMQKRKMLHNALAAAPDLDGQKARALLELAGIDPNRRAQTLAVEEWKRLTETYVNR